MATVQETLDRGEPNTLPDALRQVSLGEVLAGLIPRVISRTGLASSATQVEPDAGAVLAVVDTAGTTAITIVTGTAGAGEVQVTYDAQGVATLVFGTGALTAYQVSRQVLPAALATALAADNGSGH